MILIKPNLNPNTFIDVWEMLTEKQEQNLMPDNWTVINDNTYLENTDYNDEIIYVLSATGMHWGKNWLNGIVDIPPKIIRLANAGKLRINYFVPESLIEPREVVIQHSYWICEQIGLDVNQITIFLIDTDVILDDSYPDHIAYFPLWEQAYEWQLGTGDHIPKTVNLAHRPSKFICLNRVAKGHRLNFCTLLHNAGVVKDGILTYKHIDYNGKQLPLDRNSEEQYNNYNNATGIDPANFLGGQPYTHGNMSFRDENIHSIRVGSYYTDSYWNFVTESAFMELTGFITEKTFKPIANLQPFIIVSTPFVLRALRYSGYKTFGDYIDESYDTIQDPDDRLRAVAQVAIKLANMSHEQHVVLMYQIKPILIHNQTVFNSKQLLPIRA